MKKFLSLILALAMVLSLAACGEKAPSGDGQKDGPTEIIFWSNWSGATGECLQAIADQFNADQTDYVVNLTYAGSYEEIKAKVMAATAGSRPDLYCTSTEHAYYYFDNPDTYVPLQGFVDEDKWDVSDLMANLVSCYSSADGELLCAPLGNTVVGCWYNADALKAAGVDPATDLASLEEIAVACDKLQAAGIKTPFYVQANTIYYTFPLTAEGLHYVDNNNGKDGLPTKDVISQEPTKSVTNKYWDLMINMAKKGQLANMDVAWNDALTMFINGEIALLSGTISGFNRTEVAMEAATNKFEFGFVPSYTISKGAENHGQCVGGGCIFIGNNENDDRARGAWEFLKYIMKSENTVAFAEASGYLPTTVSGWNSAGYQEFVKTRFPTATLSYEAQQATKETCYNAWLPMFADWHQAGLDLMKDVVANPGNYTPESATQKLIDLTNESIELYTLSKG